MTELQPVSAASSLGMVFSLIIAIGLPIALCLFLYKKKGAKLSAFLSGCVCFFIFTMVLEQTLHSVVLRAAGTALTGNIWLYALYGGLAAAVFEEAGRFIVMKHFMKKDLNRTNALMFGVGHGGIEAILLVGLTYFNNVMMTVSINSGQISNSLSEMTEENRAAAVQSLSVLWTLPSWQFYMAGIERIQAIALHIALSVFVYKAVKTGRKKFLLLALGLHFAVDSITIAISGTLPVWAIEMIVFVLVAAAVYLAYRVYDADDERDGKQSKILPRE